MGSPVFPSIKSDLPRSPSPPATALSILSLDPSPQTPAAPKNKLAAKIAAVKAAKLAAANASSVAVAVTRSTVGRVEEEEKIIGKGKDGKKLSKLQLKMLAAQSARNTASPPPPPPQLPSSPALTELTTSELNPVLSMSSSSTVLRAKPSLFASALAPKSISSSRENDVTRIEASLARDSAISSLEKLAFSSPSPDDLVLIARKGTSLAVGAISKRR